MGIFFLSDHSLLVYRNATSFCINFVSCLLVKFIHQTQQFCKSSLGFSMCSIMFPINSDSFVLFCFLFPGSFIGVLLLYIVVLVSVVQQSDQLYVYICTLPLGPLCETPSHHLSHQRALGRAPYTIQQVLTIYLFCTWQGIYVKPNLPAHSPLPRPHVCTLCLHLYPHPENRLICTFFQIPHVCINICYSFFLFMTYLTLYDMLQVHPHLYK